MPFIERKVRSVFKRVLHPWLVRRAKYRAASVQEIDFENLKIQVNPQVFHPLETGSTVILYQYLRNHNVQGQEILELGAGSGLLSFLLARKGAIMTASDINPGAIEGILFNSEKTCLHVEAVQSDLFDAFDKRRFDKILINPPFFAKDPQSMWEYSFFAGSNLEYFKRLYQGLAAHLKPKGEAIMILSRDLDQEAILAGSESTDLNCRHIYQKRKWFEWFDIYRLSTKHDQK